ncbi:MAG TPA: VWA domain-containing protein [Vicinamibacteria bacterium]
MELPGSPALLTFLLAGVASAMSARGQEADAPKPELIVPASVEVVRLEVVVSEKRGRPRAGLRREDFAVFEDGRPQQIVQFQAFARPRPGSPAGATPPPGAAEGEEGSEELLPARYVVLVIDDVHLEFDGLARVRRALERFLDEDLRPEDQVALVTTSGASALSQEFTSDRAALRQILSRLSAQGRRPERSDVPYISEYQAELIENGDPMALDAAVQEVMRAGLYQDASTAEQVARRKARHILTEAVYDARLTLEALEALCRGLSGLSGRKALFLVSDGFMTGLSARSAMGYDLRRIADAGTRAGVVVYSLDASGLRSAPLGAGAASLRRPGPSTFGTVEAMRQRSEDATRHAMHALAADTGGFLSESSNNLRAGLREMLKDTETYYVLAYEPANTRRDGGFRRIEVRLPGQRGLEVRTRSGYFAPDDRRPGEKAGGADDEARRAEQRRAEMRTALGSLAPLTGIPVRLSADFVSLDGVAGQVVVSGSVDVAPLPFVRLRDRRQATVEAVALVHDETGQVAATLPTERSAMDLSDADFDELVRGGLPYQKAVALKPGRYQVRLAAREDATGMLGSAWRRIEVPDLASGRLAVSSLFLLKDAPASGAPASADGAPALQSVQGRPRFGRTERLYVQLYAYNPKRDDSGGIDLVAQAEVLRDGSVLGTAAPEPMAEGDAGGPVPHVSRIGLQAFEPGSYELRVTVTDRRAGALASRTVPFAVE